MWGRLAYTDRLAANWAATWTGWPGHVRHGLNMSGPGWLQDRHGDNRMLYHSCCEPELDTFWSQSDRLPFQSESAWAPRDSRKNAVWLVLVRFGKAELGPLKSKPEICSTDVRSGIATKTEGPGAPELNG
jgi:hypothetical protein